MIKKLTKYLEYILAKALKKCAVTVTAVQREWDSLRNPQVKQMIVEVTQNFVKTPERKPRINFIHFI